MLPESTVFVVDDDEAMRNSLRWLIESVQLPVKTYASSAEFLDQFEAVPGCLILDVRMPGMGGLDLQEQLLEKSICLPIIFISGHGDIPMAVHAMKAGAIDFIEKPFNDQMLLDRIYHAIELCKRMRQAREAQRKIVANYELLTPRECEVVNGVVAGKSNKAIGTELGVSWKTVEVHRANAMRKMHVNSLSQLVKTVLHLQAA
jgi:two-component system response regulator FixJ